MAKHAHRRLAPTRGKAPTRSPAPASSTNGPKSKAAQSELSDLQQSAGNQAVNELVEAGATPPTAAVQRRVTPNSVVAGTEIVGKSRGSIDHGQPLPEPLFASDVVETSRDRTILSRRGVDAGGRRRAWCHVLTLNGDDVAGRNLYVRRSALTRIASANAPAAVADARRHARTRGILADTVDLLDDAIQTLNGAGNHAAAINAAVQAAPATAGFDANAANQATQAIQAALQAITAPATADRALSVQERNAAAPSEDATAQLHARAISHLTNALGVLANVQLEAVKVGRMALGPGAQTPADRAIGRTILAIGDQIHAQRLAGTANANATITRLRVDAAGVLGTIYSIFGHAWDTFGLVAASVTALAGITAVSAVVAGVGALLGLVGAALSLRAAISSGSKEAALRTTEARMQGAQFDDVRDIATYAKNQKRKKKIRNAVTTGIGVGVAVLALVGLVGGPVAIGLAAVGLVAGLGLVLYRWYLKTGNKTRAAKKLVKGAVAGNAPDVAALQKLGIDQAVINGANTQAAQKALTDTVVAKLKSFRLDTANTLYHYLMDGSPSEMVGAESIITDLGEDPDKLRNTDQTSAVRTISGKLGSW